MLEKPDLPNETICACLQGEYGLHIGQVVFLPLGADLNTVVYRAADMDGTPYFVKLRRGVFNETTVALPKFFNDQGIQHVISPLATRAGKLWASLDAYKLILYPFVEGQNGRAIGLSDDHWREFGAAVRRIHTTTVPSALLRQIPREKYSAQWRDSAKTFVERAGADAYNDPVAVELDAFLQAKRDEIRDLVGRAGRYAVALQDRAPEFVLCHSDIHASNILISADGALYIVDWDDPILAPKERDLMFAGGGQGFIGHTAHEEETLFYQGYGQTQIDLTALAYYRYERIIQDIAIYCEQIFLSNKGGEDREQSLRYLMSNFLPNNTIAIAYTSDATLRNEESLPHEIRKD